jgi:hypothetical protein
MAFWKPYRIADVVREIDEGKFVLPVIQRRLVWDEEKMELLFDTLLKGDSFGGIMVVDEEKGSKPLFSSRPFTKDGGAIKSAQIERLPQSQFFVIDGQQRLQSFYIGILGSINGKSLYFDLYSNYQASFEFEFELDQSKLITTAKDASNRTVPDHLWYSVNFLFQKLKMSNNDRQVARGIVAEMNVMDETRKLLIEENVSAFYRNVISGECLGIAAVPVDKTAGDLRNRQKIVELFRRLNDGGTRLSPFDLVASILKGFDYRMEGFLEDNLDEFKDIGIKQDDLVKLIFILQDNHTKEMLDIDASDTDFALKNGERIRNVLLALRGFLNHAELLNYYQEGNRSFIPLFFISYHLFHLNMPTTVIAKYFDNFDTGNPDFSLIYNWLYYSLLNGIFKSKGAGWIPYKTGIKKILDRMKRNKGKAFPTEGLYGVYKEHDLAFTMNISDASLQTFDHNFVYYLIYNRKLNVRVQDIDHVHPKNLLEKIKVDWSLINHIGNFQLLDFGTNRGEKNGNSLKLWIKTSVKDVPAYLERHLIPKNEELWDEGNFSRFLDERKAMIVSRIKSYF